MKRREEKWEEEESGREEGAKWAACQPNTEPFIDRCTLTYTLLQRLSSLFLSFHRSAILYLTLTLSMSHVSSSSRLYLSPSRFSFPLLSVVVFPFSPCSALCRLALSIHRVLIFSFSSSYHPSSRPNFRLIRVLMCYPLLSMCSPTASLGNRAEGGQRASTH